MKEQFCPVCFYLLDAATSIGGEAVPGPGDFTVCIGCANVLRFTGDDLKLECAKLEDVPTHNRREFAKVVELTKRFVTFPDSRK